MAASVGILLDSNQYHVKIIGIDSESPSQKVNIVDSIPVYIQATNTSNLPAQLLLQNSNANVYLGPTTNAVEIRTDSQTLPIILTTNSGEALRIQPNTNIGIGTQNALYPLSIGKNTAIYGVKYHKLNGTNNILWNYGNIDYVSGAGQGNHYIGVNLSWNTTNILSSKEIFRALVKCHLSGIDIGYRTFTAFINPIDDSINNLPNNVMTSDINTSTTSGFTNMQHSISNISNSTISILCNWSSTCDTYKSYLSVEIFGSELIGDIQFTGISDI